MPIKRFFKFFPPPQFLLMPGVGINISDDAIRFIEFVEKDKAYVLKRFGEKKIPKGVVDAGYINDPGVVTKALSDLRKEHDIRFVYSSLPEEKVYLYQATIPSLDKKEIRENIEMRLEENVPISSREVLFDFDIIKKDEANATALVSVSVVPIKVAEAYVKVFKDAGLNVLGFDIEGRALAQSVISKEDKGTYIIVNFTEQRTGIFVICGGALCFSSSVSVGGSAVTESIQKTLNVEAEEAEKIKMEQGYSKAKGSEDVFGAAMSSLSVLKDEINKVKVYWKTHNANGSQKIDKVILCGENSLMVGFEKYLSMSLKLRVEIANVWINAFTFESTIPPIDFNDSLNYAVPAGLALANHNKNNV